MRRCSILRHPQQVECCVLPGELRQAWAHCAVQPLPQLAVRALRQSARPRAARVAVGAECAKRRHGHGQRSGLLKTRVGPYSKRCYTKKLFCLFYTGIRICFNDHELEEVLFLTTQAVPPPRWCSSVLILPTMVTLAWQCPVNVRRDTPPRCAHRASTPTTAVDTVATHASRTSTKGCCYGCCWWRYLACACQACSSCGAPGHPRAVTEEVLPCSASP